MLRRWAAALPDPEMPVTIQHITLAPQTPANLADDVDNFLNCIARRDDLLQRTGDLRWEIAMQVTPIEERQWHDRVELEFNRTNRNRPQGALPRINIRPRSVGPQRTDDEEDEIFCSDLGKDGAVASLVAAC